MFTRSDRTLPTDDLSDPQLYWSNIRKSMKEKADHNKNEAQFFFWLVIASSLSVPIFIAFGAGIYYGKLVPALLSAIVTAATSWLQIRQPQRLWTLYRRGQRRLEHEKVLHDHRLQDYDRENPGKLLVERTAQISIQVHDEWEKLVPDASGLKPGIEQGSTNSQ